MPRLMTESRYPGARLPRAKRVSYVGDSVGGCLTLKWSLFRGQSFLGFIIKVKELIHAAQWMNQESRTSRSTSDTARLFVDPTAYIVHHPWAPTPPSGT